MDKKGIRVNAVNPGFIRTEIHRQFSDEVRNVLEKYMSERTALRGRGLTFEDISEAVVFLASDDAGFITGENVSVDGVKRFLGTIQMSN